MIHFTERTPDCHANKFRADVCKHGIGERALKTEENVELGIVSLLAHLEEVNNVIRAVVPIDAPRRDRLAMEL